MSHFLDLRKLKFSPFFSVQPVQRAEVLGVGFPFTHSVMGREGPAPFPVIQEAPSFMSQGPLESIDLQLAAFPITLCQSQTGLDRIW